MTMLVLATALSATPPALVSLAAQPHLVQEVQCRGAGHLSTKDLRELTGVRPGDRMSPKRNELGRQAILRHYHDEGRFFASVALVEGSSPRDKKVVFQVVEGPVVKVEEVKFRGNTKADAAQLLAAKRASGATAGAKFRPAATGEDVQTLGQHYQGLGQDDTRIVPEVLRTGEMNRVIIVYHIVEAKR